MAIFTELKSARLNKLLTYVTVGLGSIILIPLCFISFFGGFLFGSWFALGVTFFSLLAEWIFITSISLLPHIENIFRWDLWWKTVLLVLITEWDAEGMVGFSLRPAWIISTTISAFFSVYCTISLLKKYKK